MVREEAAKFRILIDAARCPKGELSKHINKFNDHVATGIYSLDYDGFTPADFNEVIEFVAREDESHYLDGPNGYEFMYRNQIESDRGGGNVRRLLLQMVWVFAGSRVVRSEQPLGSPYDDVPRPASSITRQGFRHLPGWIVSAEGAGSDREGWRPLTVDEHFSIGQLFDTNREVLAEAEKAGLIAQNASRRRYPVNLVREWLFPLHPLELKKRDVRAEKEGELLSS